MSKFGRMITNALGIIILVAIVLAVLPALWNLVWGYVVAIAAILLLILGLVAFLRFRKKKNSAGSNYNGVHNHYY